MPEFNPDKKMAIIDTHAHIYAEEFDGDGAAMMERADNAMILNILMPAIDSTTHARMLGLEDRYPGVCRSMMGLHPCSVKENYAEELAIVGEWLAKRKFIAVGETGLDFYWDLTFKKEQYESFQRQIDWALEYDIPVVIHSRQSTDECIEMVAKNQQGRLKGVFHCFSGTVEQAKRVLDIGFYLGIGGVVTFKNSGLDKVIEQVGLEGVVLETDAPYLAPVPYRGKRNEPGYLENVVAKLAEITKREKARIEEQTMLNAQKLFGL